MELSTFQESGFENLLKAYFTEKKLTKSLINSTDIQVIATDLSKSLENMTLRRSAQLFLGLLRIFHHKFVIILSEIEDFFRSFEITPKKSGKSGKTLTTQLITMNPKKVILSFEDNFSNKSFASSTRDSIEGFRNLADPSSITLDEVNFTPKSIKSFPELDDAGSVMQIDSPLLDLQELEPDLMDTPKLSVKMMTPARSVQKRKMKIRMNNKTTLNGAVKELGKKEHLVIRSKEMSLGVEELFKKPILPVPEEILWVFNEVRIETFEFGNEGVDEIVNENENYERTSELNVENNEEQRETEDNEGAKRCEMLLEQLKTLKGRVNFTRLAVQDRKEASKTFYDLLVLANQGQVKLEQKGFNREIFIKYSKV